MKRAAAGAAATGPAGRAGAGPAKRKRSTPAAAGAAKAGTAGTGEQGAAAAAKAKGSSKGEGGASAKAARSAHASTAAAAEIKASGSGKTGAAGGATSKGGSTKKGKAATPGANAVGASKKVKKAAGGAAAAGTAVIAEVDWQKIAAAAGVEQVAMVDAKPLWENAEECAKRLPVVKEGDMQRYLFQQAVSFAEGKEPYRAFSDLKVVLEENLTLEAQAAVKECQQEYWKQYRLVSGALAWECLRVYTNVTKRIWEWGQAAVRWNRVLRCRL
jgi:hypothetical protein